MPPELRRWWMRLWTQALIFLTRQMFTERDRVKNSWAKHSRAAAIRQSSQRNSRMKMGEGKEGARPQYIHQALDASLKRLGIETIDLYQIHFPDPNTPIADTMQALNDAIKAGKVREIGCSNFSAEQIRAARATSGPRYFASVQNDYSMFKREAEAEVLPECARDGVTFLPYFPLANGLLTGKYRKDKPFPESSRGKDAFGPKLFTAENLDRVESADRICRIPWSLPAGTGILLAGSAARGEQRNRRRQDSRSGTREQPFGGVETEIERSFRSGTTSGLISVAIARESAPQPDRSPTGPARHGG